LHSNDPPSPSWSMSGCFTCDRSHTIRSLVRPEIFRTRHLSHNARPAFAFFTVASISFTRWHKPTTALRYRCSIILSKDGIHSPSCFPAANGTYGFMGLSVRLILGYTHSSQMQSFPSRSRNPQTAGRTWLAPCTMPLTSMPSPAKLSSAQPLFTIRLGKVHC